MILSPSGGLVYHARAVLNKRAWLPTRQIVTKHVANWLETTTAQELIVFGPSAAYLLDPGVFSALKNAKSLIVVDPDRAAQQIFQRRFRHHPISWNARADVLPFQCKDEAEFSNFIARWPEAPILFQGVLGQLELHTAPHRDLNQIPPARRRARARDLFLRALESRRWMSIHDVVSAELDQPLDPTFELTSSQRLQNGNPEGLQRSLESVSAELQSQYGVSATTWIDHDTHWIGAPHAVVPWRLHSRRLHLLGITSF